MNFKIISFNVNSINVRIGHVLDIIKDQAPDAILLQELKCIDDSFPLEALQEVGYICFYHCQKSYNGVAILLKEIYKDSVQLTKTYFDAEFESQARYIEIDLTIAANKKVTIASVYVPNGSEVDSEKYEYKLRFLSSLTDYLNREKQYKAIIIGGDFNVAPFSIDLADHEKYLNSIGFSYKERCAIRALLDSGMHDAYRALSKNTNKQEYSWFDYRGGAFSKNHGMRIDYILCTESVCYQLQDAYILNKWRFMDRPSDHLPVVGIFKL